MLVLQTWQGHYLYLVNETTHYKGWRQQKGRRTFSSFNRQENRWAKVQGPLQIGKWWCLFLSPGQDDSRKYLSLFNYASTIFFKFLGDCFIIEMDKYSRMTVICKYHILSVCMFINDRKHIWGVWECFRFYGQWLDWLQALCSWYCPF